MKKRKLDFARAHGIVAPVLLAALSAGWLAACSFGLPARADSSPMADPRIVQVPRSLDVDGDKINDRLETALDKSDFSAMPFAVMRPQSAIAIDKGMGQATAPVVDVIVCFDHSPTSADLAAIARQGFATKETFSRSIYAVHVIGPAPHGSQSLRDLVAADKGIVYIEPNAVMTPLLEHSTRQIRARQAWSEFAGYDWGNTFSFLPDNQTGLLGDPDISIAIMDTGIDGSHPDLNGGTASAPGNKIVGWYDSVYGSQIAQDPDGHGSHVAGIAAGTGISSNADVPNGLETGTGYLPLTLRYADYDALTADYTITELTNDNIPVNTTGYPNGVSMPVEMYWADGEAGYYNEFDVWDYTNGEDGISPFSVSADGGAPQPATPLPTATLVLPGGLDQNLYGSFKVGAENYMGFAVHMLAPETAYPDGYNFETGVAPGSSLVGIEANDPIAGGFTDAAILTGCDYILENQTRLNIGVVNMSFGSPPPSDPALDNAVDNLVASGIVCCVAAGNSRPSGAGIGSPASASSAIAVAAVGNHNQITDYSSYGSTGGFKPDVSAPGGDYPYGGPNNDKNVDTNYYDDQAITSVDSNSDDSAPSDPDVTGATAIPIENSNPDSYTELTGTSMASPHVAGAAALLEQALETPGSMAGEQWGGNAEARFIKALLEMTCNDTNVDTEGYTANNDKYGPNPVVGDLGRDPSEGWGKINVDAALSAVLKTYVPGDTATGTLGSLLTDQPEPNEPASNRYSQMAWAENVTLQPGTTYVFKTTGLNDTTGSEFDLIVYKDDSTSGGTASGGADGDPIVLAKSNTAKSVAQQVVYTTGKTAETDIVVVKWQSGAGSFTLTSGTLPAPPSGTAAVTPTAIPVASETVTVESSAGAPIPNAIVQLYDASPYQVNVGATNSAGQVTLTAPASTPLKVYATAVGYFTYAVPSASVAAGTPGSVTVKLASSQEFAPGLQLISVPYTYASIPQANSLGAQTLPSIHVAAVWQPSENSYGLSPAYPADQFHVGQGYWIRFRQNTSLPVAGSVVTTPTYDIALTPGWNMVGDPYTNPASLANALVLVGKTTMSFPAAVTAGAVGVLYSYSQATNAYTPLSTTGAMEPWVGYWIYAMAPSTLVISGQSGAPGQSVPPPPPPPL